MIKFGFLSSWFLLAAGETVTSIAPNLGTVTQLGAVGVLAWVAWTQFAEMRAQRTENTAMIQVLMKQLHDDSGKLDDTLREMTSNCAIVQTAMRKPNCEN